MSIDREGVPRIIRFISCARVWQWPRIIFIRKIFFSQVIRDHLAKKCSFSLYNVKANAVR